MKRLINEVVDRHNCSYRLFLDIERSSIPDSFDIRFFSTYSGASNPDAEQTKWQSTLPRNAILEMISAFRDETLQPYTEHNGKFVINPAAIGIR